MDHSAEDGLGDSPAPTLPVTLAQSFHTGPSEEVAYAMDQSKEFEQQKSPVLRDSKGAKLLTCKFCAYTTRFQGNLVKHIRVHTGEKPYACSFCGKRFASRSNFRSHETVHTGIKRLQCPHENCKYSANTKECMNAHLMRTHAVPVSELSGKARRRSSSSAGKTPPTKTKASIKQSLSTPKTSVNPTQKPSLPPINALRRDSIDQLRSPTPNSTTPPPTTSHATIPNSQATLEGASAWLNSNYPLPNVLPPNLGAEVELGSTPPPVHHMDVKPTLEELAQYVGLLHEEETLNSQNQHQNHVNPQGGTLHGHDLHGSVPTTSHQHVPTSPQAAANHRTLNDGHTISHNPSPVDSIVQHHQDATASGVLVENEHDSNLQPPSHASTSSENALPSSLSVSGSHANLDVAIDETRTSALSIELLRVFSKFGLDPQVIVDTLILQGKLYKCIECNIIFPEYGMFVLHRGCHGHGHPFQCHFCQAVFVDKFGFLTHFMHCPRK